MRWAVILVTLSMVACLIAAPVAFASAPTAEDKWDAVPWAILAGVLGIVDVVLLIVWAFIA